MEVFEHYYNAFMETQIAFFVPDGTPSGGGTINLIIQGKSLDSILSNMTKSEAAEYLEDLQENGVVLEPDENDVVTVPISNDLFIQNAIQYTERGGGPDFSYETKTLDLPLIGGIRVFNQEVKDEVIAKGMVCINAMELTSIDEETSDSTEQNRKFKDTSVFGVLEKKVKNLMGENETIEGVKIPWLYSKFGPNKITSESSRLNISISNNINVSQTECSTVDSVEIINTQIQSNNYRYRILGKRHGGSSDITRIITDLPSMSYYLTANNGGFSYGRFLYSAGNSGGYITGYSYGGFTEPYVANTTNQGQGETALRDIKYTSRPFIIGIVPLITSFYPTDAPSCECYFLPVAFDINGKIMKPDSPVIYEGGKISENYDTAPDTCPFYQSTIATDDSVVSNTCKGNLLMLGYLPMTIAERDYVTSQDYIIAPTDWIPDGYLDSSTP